MSLSYWGSLHKWNPAIRVLLRVSIFAQQHDSEIHSHRCHVAAAHLFSPMNVIHLGIHHSLCIHSTFVEHSLEATVLQLRGGTPPQVVSNWFLSSHGPELLWGTDLEEV